MRWWKKLFGRTTMTIEFSDEAAARIEVLRHLLGLKHRADVLKRSLALLDFVVSERESGTRFVMETSDGKCDDLLDRLMNDEVVD